MIWCDSDTICRPHPKEATVVEFMSTALRVGTIGSAAVGLMHTCLPEVPEISDRSPSDGAGGRVLFIAISDYRGKKTVRPFEPAQMHRRSKS